MPLFTFSSVIGQSLTFDPATDILHFDIGGASDIVLSEEFGNLRLSRGGDHVVLNNNLISDVSTANITFSDGSVLAVGDNASGAIGDQADNDLFGTAGADQLLGLDGNDTLTGGQGSDVLQGGAGTDTIRYIDDVQNLEADLQSGIADETVITDELVELGSLNPRNLPYDSKYSDVAVKGDFAYLGGQNNQNSVFVIDVSDPSAPVQAGFFLGGLGETFSDIKIEGDFGYFSSPTGGGVHIANLSDPSDPVDVGQIGSGNGGYDVVENASVDGTHIYLADGQSSIVKVFDISDPAAPSFVRDIQTSGNGVIHDVSASNGKLYTSGSSGSTDIFDVSAIDSAPAVLLGTVATGFSTQANTVTSDGAVLISTRIASDGDVRLFDISDPTNPSLLSTITSDAVDGPGFSPHTPILHGDGLLLVSWLQGGVQAFDISDPTTPEKLGVFDTYLGTNLARPIDGNWGVDASLGLDKLVLSDTRHGLVVVDATSLLREDGGTDQVSDIENIIGAGGNDDIAGNALANQLEGSGGEDMLAGRGGDDLLVGGAGNDRIEGGSGDDIAVFSGLASDYTITLQPNVTFDYEIFLANKTNDNVLRWDGDSGEYLGEFITAEAGVIRPRGIEFGPNGDLYLTESDASYPSLVKRFDGDTGEFIDVFASTLPIDDGNGDKLRSLEFGPNGDLYVMDMGTPYDLRHIIRFEGPNSANPGEFVDLFVDAKDGSAKAYKIWDFIFNDEGNMYAATWGAHVVFEFGGPDSDDPGAQIRHVADGRHPDEPFYRSTGIDEGPDGLLYVTDQDSCMRR